MASYGPGLHAARWQPGDFILTHSKKPLSRLIRFGERIRVHGRDRKYARWSHAALVVDRDGGLIEALGRGVCRTHISKYTDVEYTVVDSHGVLPDRAQSVKFAEYAAANYQSYGFLTIVSLAFTLTTGAKFSFYLDGTEICSGLVARALERTGVIFPRDATHCTPADLAKQYAVGD